MGERSETSGQDPAGGVIAVDENGHGYVVQGSGDGGHTGNNNQDDEDDQGSGEQEEDDYHDHLVKEMDTEVQDSDIVNVDDGIDPRDLDIGFQKDITSGPDRAEAATQTPPSIVPSDPLVPGDDPTKGTHASQPSSSTAQANQKKREDPVNEITDGTETRRMRKLGMVTSLLCQEQIQLRRQLGGELATTDGHSRMQTR